MYRDDLAAAHTRIRLLEEQSPEGAVARVLEALEAEREHWIEEKKRRKGRAPLRLLFPSLIFFLLMGRDILHSPRIWPLLAIVCVVGATVLYFAMRSLENKPGHVRDAELKIRALDSRIAEVRAFAATHGRLRVSCAEDAAALAAHDEPENSARSLKSTDR